MHWFHSCYHPWSSVARGKQGINKGWGYRNTQTTGIGSTQDACPSCIKKNNTPPCKWALNLHAPQLLHTGLNATRLNPSKQTSSWISVTSSKLGSEYRVSFWIWNQPIIPHHYQIHIIPICSRVFLDSAMWVTAWSLLPFMLPDGLCGIIFIRHILIVPCLLDHNYINVLLNWNILYALLCICSFEIY